MSHAAWCQQIPVRMVFVILRAKQLQEMLRYTLCRCASSRLRFSLRRGRHPC